jgi:hypothetical protein
MRAQTAMWGDAVSWNVCRFDFGDVSQQMAAVEIEGQNRR